MSLFWTGLAIGFVVAVPFGPIGLLCINRALSRGPAYGLLSGLGVATADSISAGIAALGLTLVSSFLVSHQIWLRLFGGFFLCVLGTRTFLEKPPPQATTAGIGSVAEAYGTMFLVTFTHPGTILSFIAIYAGWGVQNLSGHYFSAAILMAGVFGGSALWWVALSGVLLMLQAKFTLEALRWVQKASG